MAPAATPHTAPLCPVCGQANSCVPAASGSFEAACWCRDVTISDAALARIPPAMRGQACLCPSCANLMGASADDMSNSTRAQAAAARRIGVFDSGVGGLTVLAALQRRLPQAHFTYAADSAFAPYGERDASYVLGRSRWLSAFLLAQGCELIVVACNTATALAIAALRQQWPSIPFVGIEPAIKPALAAARSKPVGVLATPGTLASPKFQALLQAQSSDADLLLQPCPGLAEAIENRGPEAAETLALVERFCTPLRAAGCTTVVLGCTHYPLVAPALREALGRSPAEATLLDPADAVAAQTARIAASLPATGQFSNVRGQIDFWTNGEPATLLRIAQACGLDGRAIHQLSPALQHIAPSVQAHRSPP
ncbi:Glutamate racemase (modular protein) [Thiomonas sp. X19]|uniref:glutamate racemase n=1 Tax=Thiomonas sp. X19 TaxID=1050370 RepID=UPI000B717A13|nr:glutamate racemase [Thiomonas sp. X19]SCC95041.1 Glutamate racemase (modular protein) [Thiomonas sp. X19]